MCVCVCVLYVLCEYAVGMLRVCVACTCIGVVCGVWCVYAVTRWTPATHTYTPAHWNLIRQMRRKSWVLVYKARLLRECRDAINPLLYVRC